MVSAMMILRRLFSKFADTRAMPKVMEPLTVSELPLTVPELREIADFLQRHHVHRGYLADIYALDGFLTCVVIGPEPIPAGEWINALFAGEIPTSKDNTELDHQLALITRLSNSIATQFLAQKPTYQPLFEMHPGLGQDLWPLDAWCQGFMTATMLRDAQWEPLLRQADSAAWLYPIWERASVSSKKPAKKRNPDRKARTFNAAQLKVAVLNIRAYWIGQD